MKPGTILLEITGEEINLIARLAADQKVTDPLITLLSSFALEPDEKIEIALSVKQWLVLTKMVRWPESDHDPRWPGVDDPALNKLWDKLLKAYTTALSVLEAQVLRACARD